MGSRDEDGVTLRFQIQAWLKAYRRIFGELRGTTSNERDTDTAFWKHLGSKASTLDGHMDQAKPSMAVDLLQQMRKTLGADINEILERRYAAADDTNIRSRIAHELSRSTAARDQPPGRERRKTAGGS